MQLNRSKWREQSWEARGNHFWVKSCRHPTVRLISIGGVSGALRSLSRNNSAGNHGWTRMNTDKNPIEEGFPVWNFRTFGVSASTSLRSSASASIWVYPWLLFS
jgi:hypothetical protein